MVSTIVDLVDRGMKMIHIFCRGMTVTSGCVTISKDDSNLIGISIGGGAPMCPCLYIVQVLQKTNHSKKE